MWAQMIYYLPFWTVMTLIGGIATLTPMMFAGIGRLGGKAIADIKTKRQKKQEAKFFGKDLLALEARLAKVKCQADAMEQDELKNAISRSISDATRKLADAKNLRRQKRAVKTNIPTFEKESALTNEIQDIGIHIDSIIESEEI